MPFWLIIGKRIVFRADKSPDLAVMQLSCLSPVHEVSEVWQPSMWIEAQEAALEITPGDQF